MVFNFIKRMSRERKEYIRLRLAIVYAIVAWNSLGYYIYINHKKHMSSSNLPKELQYGALTKHTETTKVITMDGFKITENFSYNKEELDEARHKLETANSIDDTDAF